MFGSYKLISFLFLFCNFFFQINLYKFNFVLKLSLLLVTIKKKDDIAKGEEIK